MMINFGINKKGIDIIELSTHLDNVLGIKLHAEKIDDVVNGAIHSCSYNAGPKVGICWCGLDLSNIPEEHTCLIIETYGAIEGPSKFHKTTLKKPATAKVLKIPETIDSFIKSKQWIGGVQKGQGKNALYVSRKLTV